MVWLLNIWTTDSFLIQSLGLEVEEHVYYNCVHIITEKHWPDEATAAAAITDGGQSNK